MISSRLATWEPSWQLDLLGYQRYLMASIRQRLFMYLGIKRAGCAICNGGVRVLSQNGIICIALFLIRYQ
jgi:hypothetical protein